jgi:hypothetical protein
MIPEEEGETSIPGTANSAETMNEEVIRYATLVNPVHDWKNLIFTCFLEPLLHLYISSVPVLFDLLIAMDYYTTCTIHDDLLTNSNRLLQK